MLHSVPPEQSESDKAFKRVLDLLDRIATDCNQLHQEIKTTMDEAKEAARWEAKSSGDTQSSTWASNL